MPQFREFNKIARWSRDVIVTEKIDGTNGCIIIEEGVVTGVQSRNKLITVDDDNFGFAKWVDCNKDTIVSILGNGYHFGEWWGSGIQRGYNMKTKYFSLFNVSRWDNLKTDPLAQSIGLSSVPILWQGGIDDMLIENIMIRLKQKGSIAAPGFMNPEGVVIYHTAGNCLFKKTFDKDSTGKSLLQ